LAVGRPETWRAATTHTSRKLTLAGGNGPGVESCQEQAIRHQLLFVDTSAWVAVAHRADSLHMRAVAFYKHALSRYHRLITSSLIAAETYTLLRREYPAPVALQWLADLLASKKVEIVYDDRRLIEEASRLLARYADQAFSLTDALSFVIMRERGIVDAFAYDQHFRTAGFIFTAGR
jgi:hypothetical protein